MILVSMAPCEAECNLIFVRTVTIDYKSYFHSESDLSEDGLLSYPLIERLNRKTKGESFNVVKEEKMSCSRNMKKHLCQVLLA